MKPVYIKLIDNSSDHWIEATLKNYIVHLFQKHKQKLELDSITHYLQTDLDLQIRDTTFLNSTLVEIDSAECHSSQYETINKWNDAILYNMYDSFESEVIANLEIGNHKQFWKEYQRYVFYPIVKKAFYKYANRNSINQNLEMYNKSISEEFKKITSKYPNNDSILNFIKKVTSKEKVSLGYFLLFIKYFYLIEFLKGNVKLEDQADIENYLCDYLDVQIFYFFEVFNTSVKLESYFSQSAESLSSILVDDTLKKNFDNEKRLRETFYALIKEHSSKIEEYFLSNTEKINELIKIALAENKNILNLSDDIDKKQLEFQKEMNSHFDSMFIRAKDEIDEYLKIHNLRLDEILKSNSQQQQQLQSVSIAINQKQIDLEKKISEIEKYENRIQRNLKAQVKQFTKKDLEKKQKEVSNLRKSYKAKKTKLRRQEESNRNKISYVIMGFILTLIFGSSGFSLFSALYSIEYVWVCGSIAIALFLFSYWNLSVFFNTQKSLRSSHDSLLEESNELKEKNNDVREIEKNFNKDSNNTINNIFIDQLNGAQFGDNNDMSNANTHSFRDAKPPLKVTDFSKEYAFPHLLDRNKLF